MKRLLAIGLLVLLPCAALAQEVVAPVSPSNFINILLGSLAGLLTVVVLPLAYLYGQNLIAEQRLKLAEKNAKLREAIDSGAQKAIGGALSKIVIPEGKLSPVTKNNVIDAASAALVANFPDSMKELGIKDENVNAKAREIIESRLGLMDAQAAGNPVPNPTQAAPAPAAQK